MKHIATRNIRIQGWINFLSGVTFLLPIITIMYEYTGLSLPEIILISNVSTLLIFVLELPTSVLADTIGRKFSLMCSVVANLAGAIVIFCFPELGGFIIASVFSALYWAFWSGTGQAFLAENLAHVGKEDEFGKVIGGFMFYGEIATLATPLMASGILFYFPDFGYKILAGLDVISAAALVLLTYKLKAITVRKKMGNIKTFFTANIRTAQIALKNVFHNSQLRLFTLYRSLGSGITFIGIIILPTLAKAGMIDYWAGVVTTGAAIFSMFASKYAYLLANKWGYKKIWIFTSVMQAVVLIVASFFTSSWMVLAGIFVMNQLFLGLSSPVWNHILVKEAKGAALATTRSIVVGLFFLYITIGKYVLSLFPIETALLGLGCFMLFMNLLLGRKVVRSSGV